MAITHTPELVNVLTMYAGPDTLLHHAPTADAPATPIEFQTEAEAHAYAAELLFDLARMDTVMEYRLSPRLTAGTQRIVYTLYRVEAA